MGNGNDRALSPEEAKAREIELAWAQRESKRRGLDRKGLRVRLSEQQAHRCCHCGRRMIDDHPQLHPTLEHIIPMGAGSLDIEENLAVACYECNFKRGVDMVWRPGGRRWTEADFTDGEA